MDDIKEHLIAEVLSLTEKLLNKQTPAMRQTASRRVLRPLPARSAAEFVVRDAKKEKIMVDTGAFPCYNVKAV